MLRFQWDSLRRGDELFVDHVGRADLGLRSVEVTHLPTHGPAGGITVSDLDGDELAA